MNVTCLFSDFMVEHIEYKSYFSLAESSDYQQLPNRLNYNPQTLQMLVNNASDMENAGGSFPRQQLWICVFNSCRRSGSFLDEESCDVRGQFGGGLVSFHLTSVFGLLCGPLQKQTRHRFTTKCYKCVAYSN